MTHPAPAEPMPQTPPPNEPRRAAPSAEITGTPRRPAMVRRRGLFFALLALYALTLAILIYLSLRQHHVFH